MDNYGKSINPGNAGRRCRAALFATALSGLILLPSTGNADPLVSRFKNLQVLPENASAGEVIRVMKLITRALGTECRACHLTAERNFDSDALALKVKARAMMQLEQARQQSLSWLDPPPDLCLDCHQGRLQPSVPAWSEKAQ